MRYFDPAVSGELKAAVDAAVADWPGVTTEATFGCPSYRAADTLFAVVVTGAVALTRLPADRRPALERDFETGPFRAGERTVTKWVQVPVEDGDVDPLRPYLRASYEAALDGAA